MALFKLERFPTLPEKKDDRRKYIIFGGLIIAGLLGAKLVQAALKPKDIVRKKQGEKFKVSFTVLSEGYDGTFDASVYANGHLAGSAKNFSIRSGESKRFSVDCVANFPPKIYTVKVTVIDKHKREFSEIAKQKLEVKPGGVYSSRFNFALIPSKTITNQIMISSRYNIRIIRLEIS